MDNTNFPGAEMRIEYNKGKVNFFLKGKEIVKCNSKSESLPSYMYHNKNYSRKCNILNKKKLRT